MNARTKYSTSLDVDAIGHWEEVWLCSAEEGEKLVLKEYDSEVMMTSRMKKLTGCLCLRP